MSQAFTVETGGLGGESVDRVGGAFYLHCAVGIKNNNNKETGIHRSSYRQHGRTDSS